MPRLGRSLAAGDLDNDGHVDALVVGQKGPLAYLHNRTSGGHFVVLRLEGAGCNRDAVGAKVALTAGWRRQFGWRLGGGSYQSASDPRLHLGLGPARHVDAVEVTWPSGKVQRLRDLRADQGYLIRDGEEKPSPLAGFAGW